METIKNNNNHFLKMRNNHFQMAYHQILSKKQKENKRKRNTKMLI